MINRRLAIQMNLTLEQISIIEELHIKRDELFSKMASIDNKEELKEMDKKCREIEFALQDAWGFEREDRFHKFWIRPHCRCPKLDNEDRYPTGYYIMSDACPLHGEFIGGIE